MMINLLLAYAALGLLGSRLLGFMLLFMPDLSWLALVSGGFALVWVFLRPRLILSTLRAPRSTKPLVR